MSSGYGLNEFTVIGNVISDPKTTLCKTGVNATTFIMGVKIPIYPAPNPDKKYRFDRLPVVFYGGLADVAQQYLTKGKLILVKGSIQSYHMGQKYSGFIRLQLVGRNLIFLDALSQMRHDMLPEEKVKYEEEMERIEKAESDGDMGPFG